MTTMTRRRLIGGATVLGTAALAPAVRATGASAAPAADAAGSADSLIRPGDLRYGDLVRGTNARWVGRPEYVTLARNRDDVVRAVRNGLRADKRIAVRSGGHCYEGFVADPGVQAVIDLSEFNRVGREQGRFFVEPGATLADVYATLFKGWGVTIPGGSCPTVGAGGHIAGGGYGALSRLHGLTVDHLYGVEVVTVDQGGAVRTVLATREPGDPHHDLWWAHTGGGGGNFGIVTRYWFNAELPRPPAEVTVLNATWSWNDLTEERFARLVTNFGRWHESHSDRDRELFSQLKLFHRSAGTVTLVAQCPDEAVLSRFLAEIDAGVGGMDVGERRRVSWLHATSWPGFAGIDPTLRFKDKSAYMRRTFTPFQLAAIHRNLTNAYANSAALLLIAGYGGRVNTVPANATAVPQRDSVLKLQYLNFWTDEREDAQHLRWVRDFYREVHAETGGVPVPNDVTDGCFINYADVDLSDPALNTSPVPWHTLYYKENYPRLQRVKAQYDPLDVFRHAQSIRLPD